MLHHELLKIRVKDWTDKEIHLHYLTSILIMCLCLLKYRGFVICWFVFVVVLNQCKNRALSHRY